MANRLEASGTRDADVLKGGLGRAPRLGLRRLPCVLCWAALVAYTLSQAALGRPGLGTTAGSEHRQAGRLCAQGGQNSGPPADSGNGMLIAEATGPFTLGSGPVRIPLSPAPLAADARGLLASRLDALNGGRNLYVVIKDLRAEVQPGVLYHVYLDRPAGAKPLKNDPHYLGAFNFFASDYGGPASRSNAIFSYNITSVARKLRARKLLQARTTLTIIPASPPVAGSTPAVGRIELVEQ